MLVCGSKRTLSLSCWSVLAILRSEWAGDKLTGATEWGPTVRFSVCLLPPQGKKGAGVFLGEEGMNRSGELVQGWTQFVWMKVALARAMDVNSSLLPASKSSGGSAFRSIADFREASFRPLILIAPFMSKDSACKSAVLWSADF